MTIEMNSEITHANGVKEVPPALDVDVDGEEGEEDAVIDGTPANGAHFSFILIHQRAKAQGHAGEGKKKKKKKKPKKKRVEQSDPPRIGLTKIYADGVFPEGEIQFYKDECVPPHLPDLSPPDLC